MIERRVTFGAIAWSLACTAALLLVPELARACPVCMGGAEEEVRKAFIITTAFLSACPLLMVGALVWWLRRVFRASAEAAEGNTQPAGASLPSAATGPIPSAATGPIPSAATGPIPSAATGSIPSAATSSIPS
jgi:hypothetical protein